jgi:hypothetical protein
VSAVNILGRPCDFIFCFTALRGVCTRFQITAYVGVIKPIDSSEESGDSTELTWGTKITDARLIQLIWRSKSECEKLTNLSTTGQQGRQSSTVLFIFVIHAVSNTLDKKWISQPLTLDGFRTLKLEASREDNYAEPITQTMFSFFMSMIRPSFFFQQRRSDRRLQAYRLTFDVLV